MGAQQLVCPCSDKAHPDNEPFARPVRRGAIRLTETAVRQDACTLAVGTCLASQGAMSSHSDQPSARHRRRGARHRTRPGTCRSTIQTTERMGTVTRENRVNVVDFSVSGYLLETPIELRAGTLAVLRLLVDDTELVDDVEVVRCVRAPGAMSYLVAARVLWPSAAGPRLLARGNRRQGSGDGADSTAR
jgi:hypothetical protein